MTKKKWLIPVIVVGAILLTFALVIGIFVAKGYRVSVGVYIKLINGKSILVCDDSGILNSEIAMNNKTDHNLFSDLDIGDRILVIHDGIERFEPLVRYGDADIYAVFKLRDGTIEDVPEAVTELHNKRGDLETEPPSRTPAEDAYHVASYYAPPNGDKRNAIYARAVNHETESVTNIPIPGEFGHLPILKFDTLAEFEQYKTEVGDPLQFPAYFADVPVKYEEDFFAENTLMLVYLYAPSSSIQYSVDSVECKGEHFCVHMKDNVKEGMVYTDDIASWYFTVEVPDTVIENCTEFDADLNNNEN